MTPIKSHLEIQEQESIKLPVLSFMTIRVIHTSESSPFLKQPLQLMPLAEQPQIQLLVICMD